LGNQPYQYGVTIQCFRDCHYLQSSGVEVISIATACCIYTFEYAPGRPSIYHWGERTPLTSWLHPLLPQWYAPLSTQNHTLWCKYNVQLDTHHINPDNADKDSLWNTG
jgi:hypothetical protein